MIDVNDTPTESVKLYANSMWGGVGRMFTITVKTGAGAKSVAASCPATALEHLIEFRQCYGHEPTVIQNGMAYSETSLLEMLARQRRNPK